MDIIHLVGLAAMILLYVTIKCTEKYTSRFNKMSIHTSILSGEQWVQEVLDGHDERFYDEMGMH